MKVSERSVANINVIVIYCGTGIIVNETILVCVNIQVFYRSIKEIMAIHKSIKQDSMDHHYRFFNFTKRFKIGLCKILQSVMS